MEKWADFLISAVRYDEDKSRIVQVRVHDDLGDNIGNATTSTRMEVIKNLKNGKTYMTITKNENKKWQKGQDVHIIKVDNEEFIRTDKNAIAKDNLENLPEF